MVVDGFTKAKIESLQRELRRWPEGEAQHDLATLARRFQLDPMMVRGIAQAEGFDLEPQPEPPKHAATSATDFIKVNDVEEYARKLQAKLEE